MTLAIVLALFRLLGSGPGQNLKLIDVCDLARSLPAYRGKIIAVRGSFFSGRHGATVGSESCSKPSAFAQFRGGIAIDLAFPDDQSEGEPAVTYEVDRAAVRRFEEAVQGSETAHQAGSETSVVATFVGLLRVKRGFQVKQSPNGEYVGNGYGQLGRYPAQLVIRTIRDVERRSRPQEKY